MFVLFSMVGLWASKFFLDWKFLAPPPQQVTFEFFETFQDFSGFFQHVFWLFPGILPDYTPVNSHSHGKSTILMVFARKDGIFMGYVSFREGTSNHNFVVV